MNFGLALKKPLLTKGLSMVNHSMIKIIPAKSVVRDIREYRNSIFAFYIKKDVITPLKDLVTFFKDLFDIDVDNSNHISLEIVAPLEKLKKITIFDGSRKINLETDEGDSYFLDSPETCFIRASQSALCEARWCVYNKEKNTIREIFYHRISFVSE